MTSVDVLPPVATPPLWRRRRGLAIAAVAIVILLITVLTDLPVSTSRADDISAERSVMSEVNSDLSPCSYGVHQALGIWDLQAAHQLSAADRAPTPGLLGDDQSACSFTSSSIYDLSNIEVPGSTAGKDMGDLVATSVLWTTSDALKAIEAVQALMLDGQDRAAGTRLDQAERALATDREAGLAELARANHVLDTELPRPDMPSMPTPTPTLTPTPSPTSN